MALDFISTIMETKIDRYFLYGVGIGIIIVVSVVLTLGGL